MRRLVFVLFALASPFLWTCSENDTPAVQDLSEPEVRIFFPYDTEPATFVVSDSIDVYYAARDLSRNGQPISVQKVELWFARPGSSDRVLIATPSRAIDIDQVPEDIRPLVTLPAGWTLYTQVWYTGPTPLPPIGTPINTGTDVQLFALAYDAAGNVGRTEDVIRIHVTNLGDDIKGPRPVFTVSPQSGTTADTFVFDASATADDIDPPHLIRVRWDFDGNPANGWDVDWSADARADEPQEWQYVTPRSYRAILQAHNSYLPDSINTTTRDLLVTPIGGNPRPPEPDNYVDIPMGTYVLGDSSYVLNGRTYQTDAIERPVHEVLFTSNYRVEKTEVTNRLYLDYLQAALRPDEPDSATIEYAGGAIYSFDPAHPDTAQQVYLILSNSRIFYNLDAESFAIQPGYEDHPVTGVTWYGASAYALAFGLRLPTEAEWEVAARGVNSTFDYPFIDGVELDETTGPRRVNYAGSRSGADPFVDTTTPRSFYNGQVYQGFQTQDTPSVSGTYDMAGNVGEWVGDWHDNYNPGLDIDPQGSPIGVFKVVRGGSYQSSRAGVRCTARVGLLPHESFVSVGFRTAYIPTSEPGR